MASPYLQRPLQFLGDTINDDVCLGLFHRHTTVESANQKWTPAPADRSPRFCLFMHTKFGRELLQSYPPSQEWNR